MLNGLLRTTTPFVLLADHFTLADAVRLTRDGALDCVEINDLDRLVDSVRDLFDSGSIPVIHTTEPFDVTPVATALIGPDDTFIYANPSMSAWTGYSYTEICRLHYLDVVHPGFHKVVQARGKARLQGSTVPNRYDLQIVCKDGSTLWADMHIVLVRYRGEVTRLAALVDITTRKQTETTMRVAAHMLQTAAQNSPVVVLATDQDGYLTIIEGAGQTGQTPVNLIGHPLKAFFNDDPVMSSHIERVLTGEIFQDVFEHNDGVWQVYLTPVQDAHEHVSGIIGVMTDITQQHRVTRQAQRLKEKLDRERELIALKEGFVSMMSHEFRNPLTSILMSKDTLKRYGDRLDESRRRLHLDRIEFQARFMTELLDDVLLVMRANMGHLPLQPQPFDLAQMVQEVIHGLGLNETRQHAFQWQKSGGLNPVYLDPNLMRYVLVNLLNNAQKYTPEGGAISLETTRSDDQIRIRVIDTGIGIPEADKSRVFDIFKRAENTGDIKGTGLGLTMVKFAVEAHHGSISLESAPDHGTMFTIRMPARISATAIR